MKEDGRFDYYTMRHSQYGGIDVLGWGTYPKTSVLAGQPMKVWLCRFPTEEAARQAYPTVTGFSNKFTEPQVSLAHLPSEDDPVPGGMYPDDWTGDE